MEAPSDGLLLKRMYGSVPKEASEYFNVRDELAVQDGIIFKGQRCVIPKTLRQKVEVKIHCAHIGI